MKKYLQIFFFAFLGITALHTVQAQTYDPLAVQRINDLITNNGLQATYNAPETWLFAFWNDETPKQLIMLGVGRWGLTGAATLAGLKNLQGLGCAENNLTELDVSNCTQLQELYCYKNKLTKLTLTNCTALQNLQASSNQLTELDVSTCISLLILICSYNNLTELDVTSCTQLKGLSCENNHLTELDVTGCTHLNLSCRNNRLAELDVTSCTKMKYLSCSQNHLTKLDLSGLDNLQDFELEAYGQKVSLTLYETGVEEYTCPISLNNPTFGSSAISYSEEILKSTDDIVSSTSFTVQTGKVCYDCTLSGTMNFSYSIEGIDAPEGVQVKVYPNPTNGELTIETMNNEQLIMNNVAIYDVMGRMFNNFQFSTFNSQLKINLSPLPSGIYFIQIQTEKGVATVKIIKK